MPGRGKPGCRSRFVGALATVLAVAAGGLTVAIVTIGGAAPASAAPAAQLSSSKVTIGASRYAVPSCPDVSKKGALHISGKLLLKANNTGFAYYGITVFGGLEQGGPIREWAPGLPAAMAQIKASTYWHANTVRLQLSEQNAFNYGNPAKGLDMFFLKNLCQEVQQIRRQGQEVVLSDQTEWPDWNESDPTSRTIDFWKVIGTMFRNQVGFSFDLFNEPRLEYPVPTSTFKGKWPPYNVSWIWKAWKNGAKVGRVRFIGMQQLYDAVRANGDNNIIWIEGPFYDDSLGEAPHYEIQNAENIVWSIHHPILTSTPSWNRFWAFLARTYPMVDGEWGQYAAAKPECQANSQNTVPVFLKYLRSRNIGMIGWSLQPGAMLADPQHYQTTNTWVSRDATNPNDLHTPSRMWPNYTCSATKTVGEGAGLQLFNYFRDYSHIPSV